MCCLPPGKSRSGKKSLGQVVSDLARKSFQVAVTPGLQASNSLAADGIEPLSAPGVLVTHEEIDRLREAEGI